jgi:hypothetical protein
MATIEPQVRIQMLERELQWAHLKIQVLEERLPFPSQRVTDDLWRRNFLVFAIQWNWALDSTIGKSAGWADGTDTDTSIW